MLKKYKFLEHTADVKFQAWGGSIEEAFENAAYALKETILKGNMKIKSRIKKKISVSGKDSESLLYNFLEEFLFLMDSSGFIPARVKNIKIKDNKLTCEVLGDSASNYKISNDVKAVTYNSMFARKEGRIFKAQVVLDV